MGLTASVIGGYVYSGTPSLGPYQLESGQGGQHYRIVRRIVFELGGRGSSLGIMYRSEASATRLVFYRTSRY